MQDVEQQISKEEEDHFPSDAPVEAGELLCVIFPYFPTGWMKKKVKTEKKFLRSRDFVPALVYLLGCTSNDIPKKGDGSTPGHSDWIWCEPGFQMFQASDSMCLSTYTAPETCLSSSNVW